MPCRPTTTRPGPGWHWPLWASTSCGRRPSRLLGALTSVPSASSAAGSRLPPHGGRRRTRLGSRSTAEASCGAGTGVLRMTSLGLPHQGNWSKLTLGASRWRLRSNFVAESQANPPPGLLVGLAASGPGRLPVRLPSALRSAIRSGRLPHGAVLPASRALAADLAVSRWTVTQAYGQLATEGYVTGRAGSATRVCWSTDTDDRPTPHAGHAAAPPRYDL